MPCKSDDKKWVARRLRVLRAVPGPLFDFCFALTLVGYLRGAFISIWGDVHLVIVTKVSLSMFVRCEPSPFSNRDCRIQQERENIEVPTKGREQKGMEQVVVEMVVSHPRNPTLQSMQFDFRVCEECKKSYKQSTGCTYILLYLQYLQ